MASFSVFIGANKAEMFLDTAHALAIPAVKNLLSSQTFPILMMEMDGNGKFDRFDRVSNMSRFRL